MCYNILKNENYYLSCFSITLCIFVGGRLMFSQLDASVH